MSWPLLFLRFLLASTARMEDSRTEYQQLFCRMFGERQLDGQPVHADCRRWAEEGCVCPPEPPAPYIPTWDEATAMRVGWEGAPGTSTSITFSFEKEWLGIPPDLYKLYGPAGSACEAIWKGLGDGEKQKFMFEFGKMSDSEMFRLARSGECSMKTEEHFWLPLKRNDSADEALRSISGFIEWDSGPWEIKAATFYYNVEEMKGVVTKMLPYVYVPPDDDGAGGFPADRRIQIHVVAPLKVEESRDGGPAANQRMRRNFRLIQLYFSDYTFLRLMFEQGPNGEPCSSVSPAEKFKCDVFTDEYNDVIDESLADSACLDEQSDIVEKKAYIVGIRSSSTYGDPWEGGPQLTRVGFEIRKSESFEEAFYIAHRIAFAISTMTADGGATVGVRHEREVDIVQRFAQGYRMKLRDDTDGHFCNKDTQIGKLHSKKFGSTVAKVADPGNRGDIYKRNKLWKFLTLLLCSDWSKLVDVGGVEPSRNDVLAALDKLCNSQAQGEPESKFRKVENEFRIKAAQYAFQLSKFF